MKKTQLKEAIKQIVRECLAERGLKPSVDESGLTSEKKNWIQKAVNPNHKGYCSPMTKSTCTPARKALAKRFKKGLQEAGYKIVSNAPKVNEADVSSQPNELASNSGAQYKVVNGDFMGTQNGKLNRARQIQNSPEVNEASYKVVAKRAATDAKENKARTIQTDPKVNEASYKVVAPRAATDAKEDKARKIQTEPKVNETAYKVQGRSYKTFDDSPKGDTSYKDDPENS